MLLQIESSAMCTAKCVHCLRTELPTYFKPTCLRPGVLRDFFPRDRVDGLDLCGNYGDPMVLPHDDYLFGILDLFHHAEITINTVAQCGDYDTWRRLAGYKNVEVRFALESLKQSSHEKNRKNTSILEALGNAACFIESGGNATWNMIVFKHNELEVEECLSWAERMGFKKFVARTSNRFFNYDTLTWEDSRGGIEPSTLYPSPCVPDVDDPRPPRCLFPDWVYVDAWGHVFPCCYTASAFGCARPMGNEEMIRCVEKYGIDSLRLGPRTYDEIVQGPLFKEFLSTLDSLVQLRCKACCGPNPCLSLPVKELTL